MEIDRAGLVLGAGIVGCDSKAASKAKKANADEAAADKKIVDSEKKVEDALVDKAEAVEIRFDRTDRR